MKYSKEIMDKMEIVDICLDSVNALPLLSSDDFVIDESFHHEHHLKLKLKKNKLC